MLLKKLNKLWRRKVPASRSVFWSDNPWDWGIVTFAEKGEQLKNQGIIPENFDKAIWHPVGRGLWIFGIQKDGIVNEKFAFVKRRDDGNYNWAIVDTRFKGAEPSAFYAMKKVKEIFKSALELKKGMEE